MGSWCGLLHFRRGGGAWGSACLPRVRRSQSPTLFIFIFIFILGTGKSSKSRLGTRGAQSKGDAAISGLRSRRRLRKTSPGNAIFHEHAQAKLHDWGWAVLRDP